MKTLELATTMKQGSRVTDVVGLTSADGESFKLNAPVSIDGEVEAWLSNVEKAMQDALQRFL